MKRLLVLTLAMLGTFALVATLAVTTNANRLNPIGLALASYFPLPNSPTPYYGANNFASTVSFLSSSDINRSITSLFSG